MAHKNEEELNLKVEDSLNEEQQSGQEEQVPRDELSELRDSLLRSKADFDNYRKQTERRVDDMKKLAAKNVLLQLLSVVDNLELALKAHVVEANKHPLVEGVELIHAQLQNLLLNNGLVVMEAMGKQYDPYAHEALMKVPNAAKENTVIEIYQQGYILHGAVLRHAKVKISGGKK